MILKVRLNDSACLGKTEIVIQSYDQVIIEINHKFLAYILHHIGLQEFLPGYSEMRNQLDFAKSI